MSGNRLLLDTNSIIQLLKGNTFVFDEVQRASFVAISIISKLEFMSFSRLIETDKSLFGIFEKRIDVLELVDSAEQVSSIVEMRTNSSIKLPDAIIAGTAVANHCKLITADKKLIK